MKGNGMAIQGLKHVFDADTPPTATDDVTKGYSTGSMVVIATGQKYVCTDASEGAAVWRNIPNDKTDAGANVAPGVGDDETQGYSIGSHWITTNGDVWICVDATAGAASWNQLFDAV